MNEGHMHTALTPEASKLFSTLGIMHFRLFGGKYAMLYISDKPFSAEQNA